MKGRKASMVTYLIVLAVTLVISLPLGVIQAEDRDSRKAKRIAFFSGVLPLPIIFCVGVPMTVATMVQADSDGFILAPILAVGLGASILMGAGAYFLGEHYSYEVDRAER